MERNATREQLGQEIRAEVLSILFHAELEEGPGDVAAELQPTSANGQPGDGLAYQHESLQGADAIAAAGGSSTTAALAGGGSVSTGTVRKSEEERAIGRNDPCWCGSGKKYKKCHGA